MPAGTLSQRIVQALQQLEQFLPSSDASTHIAVHALTGATVQPVDDLDGVDYGLLDVRFPGGEPIQMLGPMYLRLQTIEAVRFEVDGDVEGKSAYAPRVDHLWEHLRRKYDL